MKSFRFALLIVLAGCAGQGARYELVPVDNTVWRLDTQTGSLEACGFEAGNPVCKPFPPPSGTK